MNRHLSKYALIGIINFFIGNLVFILIYEGSKQKVSYMVTLFIANLISIPISHFNQRKFVWHSNANYFKELAKFTSVNVPGIAANFLLLPLIIESTSWPVSITQVCLTFTIVVASYLAHRNWTFS